MKLPSKKEINQALRKAKPEVLQLIHRAPVYRKHRSENTRRIWIHLKCRAHGPYETPTRWDSLKRFGGRCRKCGEKRVGKRSRISFSEIKKRISYQAKKLKMKVSVASVLYHEDRKPEIVLKCRLHGESTHNLQHALNRGQLCSKCGVQRIVNAVRIPFKEKVKLYNKKYPKGDLLLVSEKAGRIQVRCRKCKILFNARWSSIYGNGTGCGPCKSIFQGQLRRCSKNSVKLQLANLGIQIKSGYQGISKKCWLTCNKCRISLFRQPREYLTYKKIFPCLCSTSVPGYCVLLLSLCLFKFDRDLKVSTKHSEGLLPDIHCPNLNLLIEVKFGDSCFGHPHLKGHSRKRYLHVLRQFHKYKKSKERVVYLVIGYQKDLVFSPAFLLKSEHYFLDRLSSFKIHGKRVISERDICTLKALYSNPVTIRSAPVINSPDHERIRKKLFSYLESNDFVYPNQKNIPKIFGVSQRRVDRAIGLGRHHSGMKARIKLLRSFYGIPAVPERRYYQSDEIPMLTRSEKILLDRYIRLCRGRLMPSEADIKRKVGIGMARLNFLMGLPVYSGQLERRRWLQKRGVTTLFIPQITELSIKQGREYLELSRRAQRLSHCLTCKNSQEGFSPLCASCYSNANRKVPGKPRPLRAIIYYKKKLYREISKRGTKEFGLKISAARLTKRSSNYQKLVEMAEKQGCIICKNTVDSSPFCSPHLQAFRKIHKKISGTDDPSRAKEMIRFSKSVARFCDRKTSNSASALNKSISPELIAVDRWFGKLSQFLEYIEKYGWPTETPGKRGYRLAVWYNRESRNTKAYHSFATELRGQAISQMNSVKKELQKKAGLIG